MGDNREKVFLVVIFTCHIFALTLSTPCTHICFFPLYIKMLACFLPLIIWGVMISCAAIVQERESHHGLLKTLLL
jgi:hypothetical protein